jgi:hypothetical protein
MLKLLTNSKLHTHTRRGFIPLLFSWCLMSALLLPPRQSVGQVVFADDFEVTCPATPCTGILAGNCLPMWFTSHGTPQVRPDLSTGNRSLCLTYNSLNTGEGAFRTLPDNGQFLPCQIYTLLFRIRTLNMPLPGDAFYQIALTNTLQDMPPPVDPPICSGVIPTVSPMQVIFSRPATDFPVSAEWVWVTCQFVPDRPFSQLWVSATATNVPPQPGGVANFFCIDDLSVTLTGPVPPASVTATVQPESVCQGESAEIRYRICNAVGLSATTYTVQASLPAGLSLMPGSVNPVAATIQGGACVANGNCVDAVFQIAVAPNQPPGTYTIPLSVGVQSAHGCINGWADEVKIEVKDCVFACPCDTPGEVNTNINGFDYDEQTGEVLLSQLITDGTLPPEEVINRCIAIHGTLRIDVSPVPPVDGYTIENCEMRMQPGSGIIVGSHNKLRLDVVTRNGGIWGCDQMWKGIRVENSAKLTSKNSNIADAQYAIWADDKSRLEILGSEFRRNYTGLFFQPILPGEFFMPIFHGNLFDGAQPLLPPFADQTPAPGAHPFAGVDVTGQSLLHIGVAGAAQPNTFRALRNGILTDNTQAVIENSIFEDILRVNTEPNYPFTGFAVRHTGGAAHGLELRGLGMPSSAAATFSNCTEGVRAMGTDVKVRQARMTDMTNGVTVLAAAQREVEVFSNSIQASTRGIQIAESPQATRISIRDNEVTAGLAAPLQSRAIAIRADGSSATGDAEIRNNFVSTFGNDLGISVNACTGFEVDANEVDVLNADNSQGILIAGGGDNLLIDNTVTGLSGLGNGIWLNGAGNIRLWCNTLSELGIGLQLSGQHAGAVIATSLFRTPMGTGLRYANGVVAPQQNGRGNRWEGTAQDYSVAAARHEGGDEFEVQSTAYLVFETTNPGSDFQFLPPSISVPNATPEDWFQPGDIASAICLTQPELQGNEEEQIKLERLIAADSIGALPEGTRWDANWALYRKLLAEPQLMAEDSVLTAFFNRMAQLPIGQLAVIEQSKEELYAPNATTEIVSEMARNLRYISVDIRKIDSLVFADTLEELPAHWYVLMEEAKLLSDSITALSAIADSLRRIHAVTLLADNASVTPGSLPEENLHTINTLYLESIASGSFAFSQGRQDTIASIAAQCPEEGGMAVFLARALQALVAPDILHIDTIPCVTQVQALSGKPSDAVLEESRVKVQETTEGGLSAKLFPNPAGSHFLLAYDAAQPTQMSIFDMFGKLRFSTPLAPGSGMAQTVDTSALESGVYLVSLWQVSGETASIRLLIVK